MQKQTRQYQAETFPAVPPQWTPLSVTTDGKTIDECLNEISAADIANKNPIKSPKRIINKFTLKEVWSRDSSGKITKSNEFLKEPRTGIASSSSSSSKK